LSSVGLIAELPAPDAAQVTAEQAEGMKAIALLPLLVLSLTGCSAIMDVVHSENESHFDDGAALFDSGAIGANDAPWLPTDATDITLRESTKTDVTATAVIGFSSDSDLIGCETTERLSLPSYAVEGGPDDDAIVKTDTVTSCGDWVFIPTADGWFGWTPSAPGEKSAT
jgi:hypothetical protein